MAVMNPFMGSFKGGAGGGAALPGLPPTDYSATYGGKPTVPNPTASASGAIGGNIGNLGALYGLGGGVNTFQQGQLGGAYNAAIPNYSGMAAQSSANIGSELAGELPQGVLDQILQASAERGITGGMPGSANVNAAFVKQLLGSSLDLTQMGEKNLSGAVARSPIAAPFDISKMFVTPEMEQEAAMAASLYASAPVPGAAANELKSLSTGEGAGGGLPWWQQGKPGVTHIYPGEPGFV
jgi:hypothetical protein